jgi:hypothetical protein
MEVEHESLFNSVSPNSEMFTSICCANVTQEQRRFYIEYLDFYAGLEKASKVVLKNTCYILSSDKSGLKKKPFTMKPAPFLNDDVSLYYGDAFPDKELKRFFSDDVRESLMMLHGKPGTGKTNYIRHLIKECSNREVLYIPPNMTSALSEPSFTEFLMDNRGIVLLIEDAEEILTVKSGRMSATQTILNITDGMLKDCFDMKIICTFNIDRAEVDKALQRKGRLYKEYYFTELKTAEVKRLAEVANLNIKQYKPMVLAEIFNHEKDNTSPTKEASSIMGFGV